MPIAEYKCDLINCKWRITKLLHLEELCTTCIEQDLGEDWSWIVWQVREVDEDQSLFHQSAEDSNNHQINLDCFSQGLH